jgi:hypothetical protein
MKTTNEEELDMFARRMSRKFYSLISSNTEFAVGTFVVVTLS